MHWNSLIASGFLIAAALVPAQIPTSRTDIMGAHVNYGRGCIACHAPASPALSNGTADRPQAAPALWGEDVTGFYEKTIRMGEPASDDALPRPDSPDVSGVVACLSCHDGNYAPPAMMKNATYEKLPAAYGVPVAIPTLMGDSSPIAGLLLENHPVGLTASIKCGGPESWDCYQSEGVVSMKGNRSSRFVSDYGFFVKPAEYNNTAVVVCTTCHQPHVRNVFTVGPGSRSGLPPGEYSTMFYLRGPYNRVSPNRRNDTAAQFCRQCHAGQSNEMNGAMIATVF
jgi:cytochrome c553